MFDFDQIERWGPKLRSALSDLLPVNIAQLIGAAEPEDIEDARDVLLHEAEDTDGLVTAVTRWIESQPIAAYHGSRLTADEMAQVRREGLRKLKALGREARLRSILAAHPHWPSIEGSFSDELQSFASSERGGRYRENRVCLTLSRAGLVHGFNYYLTYGSEFDYHFAHKLFGDEGVELLTRHGAATVFRLRVPGPDAMRACNRYAGISHDLPNLVADVLSVWSYWLANPEYSSAKLKVDCGFTFRTDLPADWIVDVTVLEDAEFEPRRR